MDRFQVEVKQYPYEKATVLDVFMVLPREACHDLEERLASEADARVDNKTVYEVKLDWYGDEKATY